MFPLLAALLLAPAPEPEGPRKPLELAHKDAVTAVAFSPDGKRLLTGTIKGSVILWDTTGKPVTTFEKHEAPIHCLAFAPGGKSFATSDEKGRILLWEEGKKRPTGEHSAKGGVPGIAFTPDGKTAVVTRGEGSLAWLDPKGGLRVTRTASVASMKGLLHSVAASPDGKQVLVGSQVVLNRGAAFSEFFRVDAATGAVTKLTTGPTAEQMAVWAHHRARVAWSPDGKKWAGVNEQYAFIVTGKLAKAAHGVGVAGIAFTPDGKAVLTADRAGNLLVSEVPTGKKLAALSKLGSLTALALSPDGKRFAVARADGKVLVRPVPSVKKEK